MKIVPAFDLEDYVDVDFNVEDDDTSWDGDVNVVGAEAHFDVFYVIFW